jgi:hypothetical protein
MHGPKSSDFSTAAVIHIDSAVAVHRIDASTDAAVHGAIISLDSFALHSLLLSDSFAFKKYDCFEHHLMREKQQWQQFGTLLISYPVETNLHLKPSYICGSKLKQIRL